MATLLFSKRQLMVLATVLAMLSLPFIAMFFTTEVNWNLTDFVVAFFLLASTGLIIEFLVRKLKNKQQRIWAIAVLLILFLLTWGELAVGLFGSPLAGS